MTGAKRKERVAEQPREILEPSESRLYQRLGSDILTLSTFPVKELSEKAKGKRRMVEPIVESTKMGTAKIGELSNYRY